MKGGVGFTGQSPWAAWMSVWHRPLASMRTRTSPGPGVGTGTSLISSGRLKSLTTAAFIVVPLVSCLLTSSRAGSGVRSGRPAADRDDHDRRGRMLEDGDRHRAVLQPVEPVALVMADHHQVLVCSGGQ